MFLQILNHLCNMLIKSQSNNYQRNQTVNHRDMMMDHGKSVLGSTRPRKKKYKNWVDVSTEQNHLSMNWTNLHECHKVKNCILQNNGTENDILPNNAETQVDNKNKTSTELLQTNQQTQ